MQISAIVAMSKNRVIGRQNQLPWHLPADLRHFKKITLGHPIVMGRNTFTSIGRALPGRRNIVISRNPRFEASGCEVFHSIDGALQAVSSADEVFIIGGAQLFQECLPKIERIYLTLIHADIAGDTFFPEIDYSRWREMAKENHTPDGENQYSYSFITLQKL